MAQRRALREVAKRIRAVSAQPGTGFSGGYVTRLGRSDPNCRPLADGVLSPLENQQQRGTHVAAWLLAAGSVTAASTFTASADAPVAPTDSPKDVDQLKKNKVIFVLGGPGSGKGTQCEKIVTEYGFTHLSAGDLLRAEVKSGSEYGNMINNMIKEGKIVPAEVTVNLLKKAMKASGNDKFLIDGFPRNKENREVFERDTGISPEFILFFDCPQEVMEKRLLSRNQGRVDDNIETIRKRFRVFLEQSLPVVEHYEKEGKVVKVDATKTPDDVFKSYAKGFTRFAEADLLELNKVLLGAIDSGDYATYARLCDPGLTCFEPEAQGHLVDGLPFHEFYFKLPRGSATPGQEQPSTAQSTISSARVQVFGSIGLVTYTRLSQNKASQKAGFTQAANETRIWQRKQAEDGNWSWKNIHIHRSTAPSV